MCKNIGLAQSYLIYFNSFLNSLSIINYIYLHKFKFLHIYWKLQLGNKIQKYKTNPLNKPLFISSQNTEVKNST
jgi:hypothetical protein